MLRALKDIQLIGNLSNRSNYDYTEEDVTRIMKALTDDFGLPQKIRGRTQEAIQANFRTGVMPWPRNLMPAPSAGDFSMPSPKPAVQAVIDAVPEMSESRELAAARRPGTNFNVTSNQASDGGKALTELMTNMVDAVLTKHALLKGIDPKGKNAPATMHEAVDQLIKKLRGGKLTSLDPKDPWLALVRADNLIIGVTGARTSARAYPATPLWTTAKVSTRPTSRAPSCP